MEQLNILTFDTSENNLKVGLLVNDKTAYINIEKEFKHIENLLPSIQTCFEKLNASKSSINYITVCMGPGSFTGIRIGISAAYGLSFHNKIDCRGFSVFDVYKYLLDKYSDHVIIPIIDAKKSRFFCSFIEKSDTINMYDYTVQEIIDTIKSNYNNRKIIFAGKDFHLIREEMKNHVAFEEHYSNGYNAKDILDFSKAMIKNNAPLPSPKAIYLRKSEAEIMLAKKHAKG